MSDWLVQFDVWLRIGVFMVLLLALVLLEWLRPRRVPVGIKLRRWFDNFGLGLINVAITRFAIPLTLVALALTLQANGWGLLNGVKFPHYLDVLIGFLLLDFVIYWQHRFFHTKRWLWQLHRVHHSDLDFDVSTAVRFHPLEILLSFIIKIAVVSIIGAPVAAVILFELVLSSAALFNHANITLPKKLDRRLRWILVTPDMHRVHHSCLADERNSNFGFNLPWWDRLFATYRAQPTMGHSNMTIGLGKEDGSVQEKLLCLLKMPFLRLAKGSH